MANTPEQLMRSRYSAYALGGFGEYLLKTWFPPMAKNLRVSELSEKTQQWIKLDVLGSGHTGTEGWVEFKAIYQTNSGKSIMHEKSVFTRIEHQWFYIGGEII
ncbi:MAG: zinc chelation protein SecC [SAR92 clade bacterium]|uniref:Zinc chelation protein SecC n=1 Tax=SAR92 clade bacterium TaxID=2315479 RepID=A0A520MF06_9GAMM|nr:MAG: zinc chelation protein SecC [SAR92 clade bacterium]